MRQPLCRSRPAATRLWPQAPGSYGLGMTEHLETYSDEAREAAGEAWLNASSFAIDAKGRTSPRRAPRLTDRVAQRRQFCAPAGSDGNRPVLVASDYAAHEAGFAAAMKRLGAEAPALYHMDATRLDPPAGAQPAGGNRPRHPRPCLQPALGDLNDEPRLPRRGRDCGNAGSHGQPLRIWPRWCPRICLTSISRPHWGATIW